MNVLVACEFSGIVRDAFRKRGHNAVSCDILPTESPGPHIQGDITSVLMREMVQSMTKGESWDLLIAHPPCTYLSNSGVRWLYNIDGTKNEERWTKMRSAAKFFKNILYSNRFIASVAIENPIPHKYAIQEIGCRYDQIIQPWMFGHGETKATCLWLKNLPKLVPTNIVSGREGRIWKESPSPNRWKNRSRTYQGIADAMAEQWGRIG